MGSFQQLDHLSFRYTNQTYGGAISNDEWALQLQPIEFPPPVVPEPLERDHPQHPQPRKCFSDVQNPFEV